jgi:indolepyruvate ferredoxin oxidoreductase beta subunit
MKKEDFNIIIAGVGGQGLITLLRVLAEAAFLEGRDVKTSELHGLSQREGSVSTHLRFGPSASSGQAPSASSGQASNIFSPLVRKGQADLILALEMSEAIRAVDFSNKNTNFLINKKFISYFKGPTEKQVLKLINKIPAKTHLIEASKICQEQFKKEVLAGVYVLGFGVAGRLIPLKPQNILKAIKKLLPQEFLEINKKAFQLGQKYEC